jgi:hypothetical protein
MTLVTSPGTDRATGNAYIMNQRNLKTLRQIAAYTVSWRVGLSLSLLLVAFVWPALYNRQVFFFPDTAAYIRGVDGAIVSVFHHQTAWSQSGEDGERPGPRATTAPPPEPATVGQLKDKTVWLDRSPFYGALLYIGEITGDFWASVALQSAAVLASLWLVLRAVGIARWPYLLGIGLTLALVSGLPFFVSLLMPDVFAPIAILACAVLIAAGGCLTWAERLAWFVLLTAGVSFHESHMLVVAALLALALVANLLARQWSNRRGLAVIGLALVVASLAQLSFDAAVKQVTGLPPLRRPFLMARLIEDGPAVRYLRESCPQSGFQVCAFLDRFPISSDKFLWAKDPRTGVFGSAPPDIRRKLSTEQFRFTRAVLAYDPWDQLLVSLRDAALQLVMLRLPEFQYDDHERAAFESTIPSVHLQQMYKSRAFRGTMHLGRFTALLMTAYYCAAAFILVALVRRESRNTGMQPVRIVSIWVLIGVALNALMCGALSGPHDRYSTRVAWLVPLVALLIGGVRFTAGRGPGI